jgi:hypothetical protein
LTRPPISERLPHRAAKQNTFRASLAGRSILCCPIRFRIGQQIRTHGVTSLAQKTAGGRAGASHAARHVGFSPFPGKAFQHKGQLPEEYFSVCIINYRHIWKIIPQRPRPLLKSFPRPNQGERSSR